jgi:hypothetical protein
MSYSGLITAIILISSAGLLSAQGGGASATITRDSVFPPVGIGPTETIQINVLNTATASPNGTAASCTGTITFSNSAGAAIGTATSFTVAGGHVASAKLPYGSSGATSGARIEIVGSIQSTLTFPQKTPCSLVFSLETFDTGSFVTHVFLGNAAASALPQFSPGHN